MIYLAIRPCDSVDAVPGSTPVIRTHVSLSEAIELLAKLIPNGDVRATSVKRPKKNVYVVWSEHFIAPSVIEQHNPQDHESGWSYHFVGNEVQEALQTVAVA